MGVLHARVPFPPGPMQRSAYFFAALFLSLATFGLFAQKNEKPAELVPINLALNKKATASSEEKGKDNFAANAVDGKPSTRWCASGAQANEWLQVDLGKTETLTGVCIEWEAAGAKYKYKVEGSADA